MANGMIQSIRHGGFFDRHPILVPASLFFAFWVPYILIFMRKGIAFGDLGGTYPIDSAVYWALFILQLGVCVISHSLTIRTIVRLYAPRWLIWGSVAFYALSPAWGLMTAADIRHPLFAAVFCVFTSSCTFALYSKTVPKWLWVQLAGGALSVSLLRAEGIWIILPTLILVVANKAVEWLSFDKTRPVAARLAMHFRHLGTMEGSMRKKEEGLWSDMCAAFLVLTATGLLFLLTYCVGWALPLGEPSYGGGAVESASALQDISIPFGANLTGTDDVGGIIPFGAIADNSQFASLATSAANAIFAFQCLPVENIAFSWVAYLALFFAFLILGIAVAFGWRMHGRRAKSSESEARDAPAHLDFRPLIIGLSMVMIIAIMAITPTDMTLRYLMPVLAAQPMFFGAIFASQR